MLFVCLVLSKWGPFPASHHQEGDLIVKIPTKASKRLTPAQGLSPCSLGVCLYWFCKPYIARDRVYVYICIYGPVTSDYGPPPPTPMVWVGGWGRGGGGLFKNVDPIGT